MRERVHSLHQDPMWAAYVFLTFITKRQCKYIQTTVYTFVICNIDPLENPTSDHTLCLFFPSLHFIEAGCVNWTL